MKRGFTLLEILVGLSIVAVLAVACFALFSRQRSGAQRVQCQGNLKQIYTALQTYSQDNASAFPNLQAWRLAVAKYAPEPEVFFCPAVQERNEYAPDRDYDFYPERMSHRGIDARGRFVHLGASESVVQDATLWILMTDIGNGKEKGSHPSVVMLDYPADCAQKLTGRKSLGRYFPIVHEGGGNFLFADGHVKWMLPEQGLKTDCDTGPFVGRG